MSTCKIAVLGSKIQYLTADIQHSLENKKANSDSQDELLDTIEDLLVELVGPMKWTGSFLAPPDFSVMQVAFQYNIFQHVPIKSLGDGKGGEEQEEEEETTASISIKELAALVKMDEGYLLRIMRLLAANKIFTEVEEKKFAHTTLSTGMAEENVAAHLGGLLSDVYKASTGLADAIQGGYPSAWEARFGMPMYEYFEKNLSQERVRMAKSMVASSREELKELARIFPWKNFSRLVDIGGGAGHLAAYLAQVRTGLFHHSNSKREFFFQAFLIGMLIFKIAISPLAHRQPRSPPSHHGRFARHLKTPRTRKNRLRQGRTSDSQLLRASTA
jgi:hypothetical protein